jgi:hypothetical protein
MGFLISKQDGANMMMALADGGAVEVLIQPGGGGIVTITTNTTLTVTSPGGPTTNVIVTPPARAYGAGIATALLTGFLNIAQATVTPATTGKLQISVWGVVKNTNGEVTRRLNWRIQDGAANTLFVGPPITVTSNGTADATATFATVIDSDLLTGPGVVAETYPLGVPVTLFLQLSEDVGSDLTVAVASTGILVKENIA